MKIFNIFTLLFCCSSVFAQIKFEKGYLVKSNGERQEVIIKNEDWRYSPIAVSYKLSDNAEVMTMNSSQVQEFGVYGDATYISKFVSFDRTTDNLNNLPDNSAPQNVGSQIFLKKLTEGDSELYMYRAGKLDRFFYRDQNGEIIPLVYKPYYSAPNVVSYNTAYKNQLKDILTCENYTAKIESSRYNEQDLTSLFRANNNCKNPNAVQAGTDNKKGKFNLHIRPRITTGKISSIYWPNNQIVNIPGGIGFGVGAQLEYVLPFNKNKWSIIVEPALRSFSSTSSVELSYGDQYDYTYKYSGIEIPVGIRHSMFINDSWKIFVNAQYVLFDVDMNHESVFTRTKGVGNAVYHNNSKTGQGPVFGVGAAYNNKASVEVSYRNLKHISVDNKYFSLIFGWNLF